LINSFCKNTVLLEKIVEWTILLNFVLAKSVPAAAVIQILGSLTHIGRRSLSWKGRKRDQTEIKLGITSYKILELLSKVIKNGVFRRQIQGDIQEE